MSETATFARRIFVGSVLSLFTSYAVAADLATPTGDVLLRVSGDISVSNDGPDATFDIAMLRALGEQSYVTSTIWTEGKQTFVGAPLKAVVEALGIEEGVLMATAVNDYAVEIPLTDAVDGGAMIAFERNGEPMSIRDKGPLWVVYPYDENALYQSEVYYSRSIWQLDRIVVKR
jgi:hypothetical protein